MASGDPNPTVLDTDIQELPGVGERRAEPLRKAGIATFRDLLRHYPRRYLDRSTVTPIRQIVEGGTEPIQVVGTVTSKSQVGQGRKVRFELKVTDEQDYL